MGSKACIKKIAVDGKEYCEMLSTGYDMAHAHFNAPVLACMRSGSQKSIM